jgi:hypothetical protein
MRQPIDGELLDDVLAAARAADHVVTANQLRRWHRKGLLPRPKQKGVARGLGSIVVYPPGTSAQLIALCKLLAQHKKLERAAWPLWWQGFPVAEHYVRDPLTRLVASLTEIRKWTRGLEASAPNSDESKKAYDRLRSFTAQFITAKGKRRLQRLFGIKNPRRFLMLYLLFLGGRLDVKDLESVDVPLSLFPLSDRPTQEDARQFVCLLSRAIQAELLSASLKNATLADLAAVRNELRQWAPIFQAINPHMEQAFPEAARKVGPLSLDTVTPDTQQFALLGYLAHRGAIQVALHMPEITQWFASLQPSM